MKRVLLTALIGSAAGCNEQLQRMVEQPKYLPYAENDFFDDGRAMRTPPAGTVPREGHTASVRCTSPKSSGSHCVHLASGADHVGEPASRPWRPMIPEL